EFTIGDMDVGECAGEVISPVQFGLADSERVAFEAQLSLDRRAAAEAAQHAYRAMLRAAQSLVRAQDPSVGDEPDEIVEQFRTRFYDTELFFDPFARGKFAQYLFRAHRQAA